MAENRYRMAEQYTGPDEGRRSDMNDDRLGGGEDVRGVADEDDEEFEEDDELEDEENDESF